MVAMSLPPSEALKAFHASEDGQQLSPGKHLHVAFVVAKQFETRTSIMALAFDTMICFKALKDATNAKKIISKS